MASNQIPDNKKRDAVIADPSSSTGSPKRADTLNGSPRTKSLGSKPANFSEHTTSDAYNSAPPPNNPYKGS
jgi:hypothetical protein